MLGLDRVAGLIHDWRDLAYLMRALPSYLSASVLGRLQKEQLERILHNERGWQALLPFLETQEVDYLAKVLEIKHHAK